MYNLHSREGQGEIIEGQNKNIIYRFALTMKLDSKFLHNLSHENTIYVVEIRARSSLGERKYAVDN